MRHTEEEWRAYQEREELRITGQWYEGRWWRVIGPDGELWCETSDGDEARESMRPGDTLQRIWEREEQQWRDEPQELNVKLVDISLVSDPLPEYKFTTHEVCPRCGGRLEDNQEGSFCDTCEWRTYL